MNHLSSEDLRAALVGCAILGCGGGGDLDEALEYAGKAEREGLEFRLADLDELPPETMVTCTYGVGALTSGAPDDRYAHLPLAAEYPAATAVRVLQDHLGVSFGAILCGELGALSLIDALLASSILGLPMLDADPAGRAVPEVQHSLLYVHGIPTLPQALANEFGETLLALSTVDDFRDEVLVRALAAASRNLIWAADHAAPLEAVKAAVIPGAIRLAMQVGAAFMSSGDEGPDAVAATAGGRVLFRGRVASAATEDRDAFTYGEFTVAGAAGHAGHDLRVWFKNENLMAWRDGEPIAMAPDLICVIDEDARVPVTNPNAREGMHVAVVGIPAPEQWLTPKALEVFSPRAFGFDLDYRPFAELSADTAGLKEEA